MIVHSTLDLRYNIYLQFYKVIMNPEKQGAIFFLVKLRAFMSGTVLDLLLYVLFNNITPNKRYASTT